MSAPKYFSLLILYLASLTFQGCFRPIPQHAYYVSPLNGNLSEYHPLPLAEDSARFGLFAGAGFSGGSANENGKDRFQDARISLTAAHHCGSFQFYYGVDGTLGSYSLGRWDSGYAGSIIRYPTTPPLHADILNSFSGPRTFGNLGFHGGINAVIPFRGGEWRIIGLETSLTREFGDYLSFRKKLADSLSSLDIRSSFYGTMGLSTELVGRTQTGEFGFRVAGGWMLGSAYRNLHIYDDESSSYLSYGYFSFAFHYTYARYTGFVQLMAATKASSYTLGMQIRLGSPRLPAKKEYRSWQRAQRPGSPFQLRP